MAKYVTFQSRLDMLLNDPSAPKELVLRTLLHVQQFQVEVSNMVNKLKDFEEACHEPREAERVNLARCLFSVIMAKFADDEVCSECFKIYQAELEKCHYKDIIAALKRVAFEQLQKMENDEF